MHQRPADDRDAKRHEPDEQVFPQPGKEKHLAVGEFAEDAVGENPPRVQTDRQPERARLEPSVGENASDDEEGEKAGREQRRIGELIEGMGERDEAGSPVNSIVRRSEFRRFHEVDDGENCRGKNDRAGFGKSAQEDAEDEAAKENLFEHRNDNCGADNSRHLVPKNGRAQPVNAAKNEEGAGAKKRDGSDQKTRGNVRRRARTFR